MNENVKSYDKQRQTQQSCRVFTSHFAHSTFLCKNTKNPIYDRIKSTKISLTVAKISKKLSQLFNIT